MYTENVKFVGCDRPICSELGCGQPASVYSGAARHSEWGEVLAAKAAKSGNRREEQKQRTRAALMEAALQQIAKGKSFDGLTLRVVTAKAGVTPASFYRHFKNMDELGMALVDQSCQQLRGLIRMARQNTRSGEVIVSASIATFIAYVNANRLAFQFLTRERVGGRRELRQGIDREIQGFIAELASDLSQFPHLEELSRADLNMIAALIVDTVVNAIPAILELPPEHPDIGGAIAETLANQLRIIILGALSWRPGVRVPDEQEIGGGVVAQGDTLAR